MDYDDDADMGVIDGWEEITDEARDKLRKALKQGHVDDEDWKGVSHTRCKLRSARTEHMLGTRIESRW